MSQTQITPITTTAAILLTIKQIHTVNHKCMQIYRLTHFRITLSRRFLHIFPIHRAHQSAWTFYASIIPSIITHKPCHQFRHNWLNHLSIHIIRILHRSTRTLSIITTRTKKTNINQRRRTQDQMRTKKNVVNRMKMSIRR